MSDVILEAKGLRKEFVESGDNLTVLQDVNLTVKQGDLLAVVGTSGCGKSTLLNLLAGLDRASGGEVALAGNRLAGLSEGRLCQLRSRYLGFVFQFHHLLPEFSALENAAMPLLIAGESPKLAHRRAAELLQQVGLAKRSRHKPGQLSGGERQRVAIARSLVTNPALVLADEPTGNLDEHTADGVQQLLMRLNRERDTAFLIVTHDGEFAGRCQRRLRLHDGELQESA